MNAFPPKHLQVVPRHNHGDRIKLLCLRSCGSTLVENQICFKKLSTDGNPLIATPENCNLPINCNFFLQPNQAYYKSG